MSVSRPGGSDGGPTTRFVLFLYPYTDCGSSELPQGVDKHGDPVTQLLTSLEAP